MTEFTVSERVGGASNVPVLTEGVLVGIADLYENTITLEMVAGITGDIIGHIRASRVAGISLGLFAAAPPEGENVE